VNPDAFCLGENHPKITVCLAEERVLFVPDFDLIKQHDFEDWQGSPRAFGFRLRLEDLSVMRCAGVSDVQGVFLEIHHSASEDH
jgi:hypothetical protein